METVLSFLWFATIQCIESGRLGRKPMAHGVAAGAPFPFLRRRPGALGSIAAVGCDLPERGHRDAAGIIGFVSPGTIDRFASAALPESVPTGSPARSPTALTFSGLAASGCVCSHAGRLIDHHRHHRWHPIASALHCESEGWTWRLHGPSGIEYGRSGRIRLLSADRRRPQAGCADYGVAGLGLQARRAARQTISTSP
jgi:hypothetical protein